MAKVHIIGAGLAGLSAAVKLIKRGKEVVLYEASAQAGGRCRSYFDKELGRVIDNGNHLLLGSNRAALAYVKEIGSAGKFTTGRHYPFIDLRTGETGAFDWVDGLRTLNKLLFAGKPQAVKECIGENSTLYHRFVYPFCTSVLNTEPHEASAVVLRRTLLEIMKAGWRGFQYYLPTHPLSDIFVEPSIKILKQHSVNINYNYNIKHISLSDSQVVSLQSTAGTIGTINDQVILATTAHAAAGLLPHIPFPTQTNAIVNGHFACDIKEPPRFVGVAGGIVQWIFIRDGLISTTTSAANELAAHDNNSIAQILWQDVQRALKLTLPLPPHRIICEKRATLASAVDRKAPQQRSASNLLLAGDYMLPNLPCTIDSAVQSGLKAAALCP